MKINTFFYEKNEIKTHLFNGDRVKALSFGFSANVRVLLAKDALIALEVRWVPDLVVTVWSVRVIRANAASSVQLSQIDKDNHCVIRGSIRFRSARNNESLIHIVRLSSDGFDFESSQSEVVLRPGFTFVPTVKDRVCLVHSFFMHIKRND